jgi:hypothetical protein
MRRTSRPLTVVFWAGAAIAVAAFAVVLAFPHLEIEPARGSARST